MALFVPSPFEIDTVYIIGLKHEMTCRLLKVLAPQLVPPVLHVHHSLPLHHPLVSVVPEHVKLSFQVPIRKILILRANKL